MNIVLLIGRIILGGYFLYAGTHHFTNLEYMAGYAKMKGTPAPKAAVAGTGVLLVLGGLSLLFGVRPMVGCILLLIFLAGASPMMHDFWKVQDPQQRTGEMINFTKNLALAGAVLMILTIPGPWPLSLWIGR
ncbi:MAG: DoxX family membrane protein [Terriglobia bacterium]